MEFKFGVQQKGTRRLNGFPLNIYNLTRSMKIFIKGNNLRGSKLTLQVFDGAKFVTMTNKVLKFQIDENNFSEPMEYVILDENPVLMLQNHDLGKRINGKKPFYRLCVDFGEKVCHYSYFVVRNGGKFDRERYMNDLESYIGAIQSEIDVHKRFEEIYGAPNKEEEDDLSFLSFLEEDRFPSEIDLLNNESDHSSNKRAFDTIQEDESFDFMPSKYTKWDQDLLFILNF
jgi:hypothetical protein